MAFKMKGSPMQRNYGIGSPMKAEGEKGNFLQRLGKEIFGKDARQKRVDKQAKRREGTEYEFNPDGTRMTSMEAMRAEKKSRKPGESKWQADSRRKQEARRATKTKETSDLDVEFKPSALSPSNIHDSRLGGGATPRHGVGRGGLDLKKTESGLYDPLKTPAAVKPKAKKVVEETPKTKVTGAIGSKTRKEQYDAMGFEYDDTIKGYNRDGSSKTTNKKDLYKSIASKLIDLNSMTGNKAKELRATIDAQIKEYKKLK